MKRTLLFVLSLAGLACAQGTSSGGVNWPGGGIWGPGSQQGSPGGDLPLPDFTAQGGVALSLPQLWVDPEEPFTQTPVNVVYVGNTANGCPTAPARTNYKGQSKSPGACDFFDSDGTGLQTVANDWAALSGGIYDQRWDVVVTHGTSYDFGNGNWSWPTKYNGTVAVNYLVFHSDCTAAAPCTGTNDLGYNPRGRQACSHGVWDMISPPLPSMGYRNHGCQGYLGFPDVGYPVPIATPTPTAPGPYTYDPGYNDLANMFTITSSTAGSPVVVMAAASTLGGPHNCDASGGSGSLACPVQGVNHIWATDIHVTTHTTGTQQFCLVNFRAQEWGNNPPDQTVDWAGATSNHVGLSQFYLDGTTDDDGFGAPRVINGIRVACAYCALTHGYIDGIKTDGAESHAITTDGALGPIMLADLWIEGGTIGWWGGGGGNPAIRGSVPTDVQGTRIRVTYNPRWYPQPAGNQSILKKISGGSCTGGTSLDLTIPNSTNAISNSVVYLSKIKDSGGTAVAADGWYTSTSLNSTDVVISVACSGTPATGSVYGYANNYLGPINISAAAMNAAGKDATLNNPVEKDRIESKSWQRVVIDGLIDENAGVDGQEGQLMGNSLRAYSNVAYNSGNETARIQDFTLTNFIARNATEGILMSSRSGSGSWVDYPITSISCNGTTQAVITAGDGMQAKMYDAPNFLPDLTKNCSADGSTPCTGPSVGSDVYVSGAGTVGGTPLIADGWYTTAYPTNGNYALDTTITVLADMNGSGPVCTTSGGSTNSGTIYAVSQGAGHGVSWPIHRMVYQNGLIYGLGDHQKWNGGGTAAIMQAYGSGNNFTVQVTVNADNLTATAAVLANDNCPGSKQCPSVIQALPGDLAYVRCPDPAGMDRFSSGPASSKGVPILWVATDQLSFSYTPQNATSPNQLHSGDSVTCPLETPLQHNAGTQTGYYNNQSFPWPFYVNHITGLGVNGMDFTFGAGLSQFNKYGTFTNSFQLVPGPSDIAANNSCPSCRYGFVAQNSETYDPADQHGVTNGNDRNTLTMKSYALSTRNITNYLMFPCGSPSSNGCQTNGNPSTPGTNSVPLNVATAGAAVTCNGGLPCNSTNYIPDSIGFVGAMNTHNYPFSLADFRQYALDPSSPYHAGGILQATDGLDNGAQIPLIVNAISRTLYPCPLPCGAGPHRDGPQYGFLQWSPYTGAVNYRVYRDGGVAPVGTVTTTWFDDYGLPSGSHSWSVKAWDGSAEHVVSGLVSQTY